MGRHVGRSRGCQTCVKRRVKCSEETPECYQCISSGFQCPGPVQGPIFIDMAKSVRQKSTRTVSKQPNTKALKTTNPNSVPDPGEFVAPAADSAKLMRIVPQAFKLPTSYQPNRQDLFQDLYVANFISAQDANIHPWILELPNLISTSSEYKSELYGIRAATLAFYAKLSRNTDLEVEASKWYSKGLVAQQEELHLATNKQDYCQCWRKAIGAAMIFSYFECVVTTVPMGWMHHCVAAIKMFEIAGPENCKTGLLHMLFRSIRLSAFTISLTADEPSVFASEEWCTIPFSQNPQTPFDKLLSILLQLPSLLPLRNEMRKIACVNPTKAMVLRVQLGVAAKHLLSRLSEFWEQHKQDIDPEYDNRFQEFSSASNFLSDDSLEQHQTPCTQKFAFKSSPDAYFTSMYDSGKIIVLRLRAAVSVGPTLHNYNREVVMHGNSILASAAYCESQGAFDGVSFSMVFPLKMLCLLSPSDEQRIRAGNMLLKWGEERGLEGICSVAAPSYLDRSHG